MADEFGKIGSAHIDVEGDFTRFYQQAREAGGNVDDVTVNVRADTDPAKAQIEDLEGEGVTVPVGANLDPLEKEFAQWKKRRASKQGKESGLEWSKGFLKSVRDIGIGGRIAAQIKPVAMIAGLGLVTQAASAAAAGVVALTASLTPLSGAMIAPISGMTAFAQSMGVAKLATAGMGEALGGLNEKMDPKKLAKLTPAARDFVKVLDGMKPKVLELQKTLQAGLFPGLTSAVQRLAPLFERFQAPLRRTAETLGTMADNASRALVGMAGPIESILNFNNKLIESLGKSGGLLGKTFVDVLVTAQPLVMFMAKSLEHLMASLNGAIGGNQLTGFFEASRKSLVSFSTLIGNLGSLLGGVLKAAMPFGNELLGLLNDQVKAASDFVNSVGGQSRLKTFFEAAMPSIKEIGLLVRDLGAAFFKLAETPGLSKILATFRTQLLPSIIDLVDVTTREFLPVLLPALTNLTKLFIKFSGTTGALTKITEAVGNFAGWLNKLFDENPKILTMANNLATMVAVVSFAGMTAAISSIAGFVRGLKFVKAIVAPVVRNVRFLWYQFNVGSKILPLVRGAFVLLGRVVTGLVTGPVGLLAGIMLGIGSAFTWAYERSETVRAAMTKFSDVVLGAIPGLRTVIENLSDFVTYAGSAGGAFGALGAVIGLFKTTAVLAVRGFVSGLKWLVNSARAYLVTNVGGYFRSLGATISAWLAGIRIIFAAAAGIISSWWLGVKTIFSTARETLSNFGERVRSILGGINLFSAGKSIISTLLDGMKVGFEKVKDFISGIADWIRDHKGPVSADAKLLVPAGKAIMAGFSRGLNQRWSGVKDWVTNIGGFFKGAIGGQSLNKQIADILLGKGGIGKLNNGLAGALNISPSLLTGGLAGFLHPTSGWGDTLGMGRILEKMFHVGITDGLRPPGTRTSSGNISQHSLGQALDFGTSRGTFEALTHLAAFTSKLHSIFKQVIWQNRDWSNGGFIPDHMDHVHVGWQARKAGGGVRKNQPYQWNERGREILVPHGNGYVMNASRTKELISALKGLKGGSTDNRKVELHINSPAADPRAVAGAAIAQLGGAFSLA